MYTLNKQELGCRIVQIRKAKGLSQNDLAKSISISRPSLVQIELGKRSVDVFEMQLLASVLGFSMDEFLSANFMTTAEPEVAYFTKNTKHKERVSIPNFDFLKFKNTLLYIIEKTAGKVNINESILFKILYLIDFNNYEIYESHLSSIQYRKLSGNCFPKNIDTILKKLLDSESILRIKTKINGVIQLRYIPLEKSDLTLMLASEKEVIDQTIDLVSNWTEGQISAYTINDMPIKATKEGDDINYELAFYREAPYTIRSYSTQNKGE